jgi:hypothetical protein
LIPNMLRFWDELLEIAMMRSTDETASP